jgi:hypothetical protein
MADNAGRPSHFVQSLGRGLAVIGAFDADHTHLSLTDVARRTGLTRAAARRFLLTLADLGYVRADGRLFTLTPRVLQLGYAYLSSQSLPEVAEPHLDAIDVALVMTVRPGFGGQSFLKEVVPKLRAVKDAVGDQGVNVDVEVDGGVNLDTVQQVVTAGADIVVAGSAIFDGVDPAGAAKRMRDKVDALAGVTG